MKTKETQQLLEEDLKREARNGDFDTKKKPQKKDKTYVWAKSSTGKYKIVYQTK